MEKWYLKKGKETSPVLIKYNKVVGGRTWFGFLVSGVDCRLQVSPLGLWFLRVPPCTMDQSILSSLPLYLRRDGSVNPRISGKLSSFPAFSGTNTNYIVYLKQHLKVYILTRGCKDIRFWKLELRVSIQFFQNYKGSALNCDYDMKNVNCKKA